MFILSVALYKIMNRPPGDNPGSALEMIDDYMLMNAVKPMTFSPVHRF